MKLCVCVCVCVCVCIPLASKEECRKEHYLLMIWIRSAQIRALERPLTSLTDNIVMKMKKETLSQVTFKNTASAHMLVVPDSVFTKTVRSPHSFCSHHSPSGLMSPNMTVSAAGSYQFLLCPG